MADGAWGSEGPAAAGSSGAGRQYVRYSEALAGELCRRVAAGERLGAILREAGMPRPQSVWRWKQRHPAFGAALDRAYREARVRERQSERQARAAWVALRRRPGQKSRYTPEMGEEICRRLADGESGVSIARDPAMPCYAAILKWVRLHPEFEAMYVEARRIQADYYFDEAREVALAATAPTVRVARLRFDVTRWQAAKLAPVKYIDRLLVEQALGETRAAAAAAAAADAVTEVRFRPVHFHLGPNREVLASPPRSEAEAARWVEAYGLPYDGRAGPPAGWRAPAEPPAQE